MHDNPSSITSETYRQKRQDALEALGSYQKRGVIDHHISEIADQLVDESDRGVVVILGSLLEDILLERIQKEFAPLEEKQIKNLTRGGGLLANFDDRINLARALGLIDDDMVDSLQLMKAMRNACAHCRQDITFLTPELANVLALMFEEENGDIIRTTTKPLFGRIMYITYFVVISEILRGSQHEEAHEKGQRFLERLNNEFEREAAKLKDGPEPSPGTPSK